MTNETVRLRASPFKAAILRTLLGAPRNLTRIQRLRTWARRIVGLAPLEQDRAHEYTPLTQPKPMPESRTGTMTFRRPGPFTGDRDGLR